jgi:hypothetical protein
MGGHMSARQKTLGKSHEERKRMPVSIQTGP